MASVREILGHVIAKHFNPRYLYDNKNNTYNFYYAKDEPIKKPDKNFSGFKRSTTPVVHSVKRRYVDETEGKKNTSGGVFPMSYIYDSGVPNEEPVFYPSPAHLLVANRERIRSKKSPLVQDETPYIIAHYRRLLTIPAIQRQINGRPKAGFLSDEKCKTMMHIIDAEQMFVEETFSAYETSEDQEILGIVESLMAANENVTDAEIMEELRDMQM